MMDQLYLSYDSLDGRTPAQRMSEHGCYAASKGEIITALVMYVYVDRMEAAEAMMLNMIKDELNPDSPTGVNIFNPEFREVGLSFLSGQVTIVPGTIASVYLAVVDFAHSPCW